MLKISIFPLACKTPKTKEDKIELSFLTSKPNKPEVVFVKDDEDLINYVTKYSWSPFVFDGYRHSDNFVSVDFMGLDVDNGLRIEDIEEKVQNLNLCCFCLPSPSHTEEHHKFRLIFPLSKTILRKEVYEDTWDFLFGLFPEIDKQCSDLARWYCKSSLDSGFYQEGNLLNPVENPRKQNTSNVNKVSITKKIPVDADLQYLVKRIYGKEREDIPESVDFFLKNAHTGLPGQWINSLNSFCLALSLTGIDEDVILDVVESLAPSPLDSKDLYQINKSFRDGQLLKSEEDYGELQ